MEGRTVLLYKENNSIFICALCFSLESDAGIESFQLPVEASYPHQTAKSFQLLYCCRLKSLSHVWLILPHGFTHTFNLFDN